MGKKDDPVAASHRVHRRRDRLTEQGLKEASSVIVPIHREGDLRAIAKQWTDEHLKALGRDNNHQPKKTTY